VSHGYLSVLAGHVFLEIILAVQSSFRLRVVVDVESHLADAALEAELVEDSAASCHPLHCVH